MTTPTTRARGHRLITTAVGGRGQGVAASCACGQDYGSGWTGKRDETRLRSVHQHHLRAVHTANRDIRANQANAAGRYVETSEFVKMVRRLIRAAGSRVATMDPEALAVLAELSADVRAVETAAALELNKQGYSWAVIGAAQGVNDTSAYRKYRCDTGRGATRKNVRRQPAA